jgi:DNA processing protein
VFALPGNVDAATCEGSNSLLREGAIPFMSADDIIDEYIELYPEKINVVKKTDMKKSIDNKSKVDYIDLGKLQEKLEGDEKTIILSLGTQALSTDDLISNTRLSPQNVQTALTMLELDGYIKRDITGKWEINI